MEFVSQGCLKLTGYQSSELLFNCRSSYQEIVHPEDRTRVDHVIRTALAARKNYVIEYRIVRADGEVRWVRRLNFDPPSTENAEVNLTHPGACY
jgi:PAS domain S-box-containing protein